MPAAQATHESPLDSPTKKRRVPQPVRPPGQRPAAGFVLCAVWDVVPDDASTMHRLAINADDAESEFPEGLHHRGPAERVGPVFAPR